MNLRAIKFGTKGAFPWLPVIGVIVLLVASFLLYSALSGKKYVQQVCYSTSLGKWVNIDDPNSYLCDKIPFQQVGGQPAGQTAQTPQPKTPVQLSIKDLQVLVQEPYSDSWSAYSATAKFYMKGTNIKDPTATAFGTVTISSGSGSQTSWNRAMTDVEYIFVLDGAGTYYDKKWEPFFFLSDNYNKNLGTYTLTLDASQAPAKVGTFDKFWLTNTTAGASVSSTSISFNNTKDSGISGFKFKIGNTGANTALYDVVLDFESDKTNPMEGDEFTSVTLVHDSGMDFGLPSDISNYVSNEVPIPVTDVLGGGQDGTYKVTFTYSATNFAVSTDKLYMVVDDLGGWLNQDVLPANKGATAQAYDITRSE